MNNSFLVGVCRTNSYEECTAERPLAEARIKVEKVTGGKTLFTAGIYITRGVDVILNNLTERDEFKSKYKDRLSKHTEGL